MTNLQQIREIRAQFHEIRLFAAEFSAVGRFHGYRGEFITWLDVLNSLISSFPPAAVSKRSITKALKIIDLGVDGGFYEIACQEIESAIDSFESEIQDTAFELPSDLFSDFLEACNSLEIDPQEKALELFEAETRALVKLVPSESDSVDL